jgi:hypothetical protein
MLFFNLELLKMKTKNSLLLFIGLIGLLTYIYYDNHNVKRANKKLSDTVAGLILTLIIF